MDRPAHGLLLGASWSQLLTQPLKGAGRHAQALEACRNSAADQGLRNMSHTVVRLYAFAVLQALPGSTPLQRGGLPQHPGMWPLG